MNKKTIFRKKLQRKPSEHENPLVEFKNPFVSAKIDRTFIEPYTGDVFVWDIDKTYLKTHFSSLRGLAAIPFELALDKQSIPGTVPLLRALRRGIGKTSEALPLFFVSGSPPQLRNVIQQKMLLDGVQYDGIFFKDQWRLVRSGRPKDVKSQIGYKLSALLYLKLHIPGTPRFYCFGDDVESDAEIFCLFSEILKGMEAAELGQTLKSHLVHKQDIKTILKIVESQALQESVRAYQNSEPVAGAFIHLERKTSPEHYENRLVHPSKSFLQTALLLIKLGRIHPNTFSAVTKDMRNRGYVESLIDEHIDDACERFAISEQLIESLLSS